MAPTSIPRIAILGAGPAGLTLASLLTRSSTPYTLFDLRPPPTSNSPTSPSIPSGSLDLHIESGLLALENCGLLPRFQAIKTECSEDCVIADREGTVHWRDDGMGVSRPETARNDLSHLLLSSIPEESVKWGHKLLSITPSQSSDAIWTLHFKAEEHEQEYEEDFDFIVGADGAWSRTRSLLSSTAPHFSGVNCITLTIPSISTHPALVSLIGQGSFFALGEHKAVMTQRGSLDSARVYLMLQPSTSTSDLETLPFSHLALKQLLLSDSEFFGTWGEGIKDLIATGCDAELESGSKVDAKPLHMLPVGFTWDHRAGVTVIGDAAHLMTPFASEGVNCGMLDALELSQSIVSSINNGGELDEKVKVFEKGMWERISVIAGETWGNLETIFEEDAPGEFVKFMQSHGPPPEEE